MSRPRTRVYLYVLNPKLRARLIRQVRKCGFEPVRLDHHLGVDPTQNVVLVETGDDVAHLCQVVAHFYLTYKTEATLPIIAFLSKKSLKKNSMLRHWLIDGRAATTQIIPHKKGRLSKCRKHEFRWSLLRLLPLYHSQSFNCKAIPISNLNPGAAKQHLKNYN